jgi:hypothetical protein
MKNCLGWSLLCIAFAASNSLAETPPQANIAFDDQFERDQDIQKLRGDIVVVLYGDSDAVHTNRILGDKIHVIFHPSAKDLPPAQAIKAPVAPIPDLKEGTRSPEVRIVHVACLGKTIDVIKAYQRQRMKKESPETAVLLDFENKMKNDYGMKAGEPNLLVIDAQGRLRLKMNGELIPASYTKVIRAVEFLRREAAGAP